VGPGERFVLGCCLLSVAVSLWWSRGIWADGLPMGTDMGAHVVRADLALDQFTRARWDGWQARFGLGYQQSLFLGPGFNLLVALIEAATAGTISTVAAVKAAMVVSHAALPPAVALLAAAFGLHKRAVGAAALLTLGITVSLGGAGLAGLFVFSLLPNALGAVFTVLATAGAVFTVRRPTVPRVVGTAVSLALVLVTHPWAAIVAVLFVPLFLVGAGAEWLTRGGVAVWRAPAERSWRLLEEPARRLAALAISGVLAGALAGIQMLPVAVHRDLKVTNASFPSAPVLARLADALAGSDFLRPYLMLLVLAGLMYVARLAIAGRPMALPLALTPVLMLAVVGAAQGLLSGKTVALQLLNRSLFFIAILGVLAAAVLVGDLGAALAHWAHDLTDRSARLAVAASIAVPVLVPLALVTLTEAPPGEAAATVDPPSAVHHAAEQLRARVAPTGRFVVQHPTTWVGPRDQAFLPQLWLAWASGRNALNVFNIESSAVDKPVYEGDELERLPPAVEADTLVRYGVTHVLLFQPEKVPDLLAHERFRTVWREDGLILVEVLGRDGRVSPVPVVSGPTATAGRVVRDDPEHLAFELEPGPGGPVTLAVGWSPKWRARVNGQPVRLGRDAENLLTVDLPAGPATVELDFGPDLADGAGTACTLAAAVVSVLLLRRARLVSRIVTLIEGRDDHHDDTSRAGRGTVRERRPELVSAGAPD
jgi:hypothetical protein